MSEAILSGLWSAHYNYLLHDKLGKQIPKRAEERPKHQSYSSVSFSRYGSAYERIGKLDSNQDFHTVPEILYYPKAVPLTCKVEQQLGVQEALTENVGDTGSLTSAQI